MVDSSIERAVAGLVAEAVGAENTDGSWDGDAPLPEGGDELEELLTVLWDISVAATSFAQRILQAVGDVLRLRQEFRDRLQGLVSDSPAYECHAVAGVHLFYEDLPWDVREQQRAEVAQEIGEDPFSAVVGRVLEGLVVSQVVETLSEIDNVPLRQAVTASIGQLMNQTLTALVNPPSEEGSSIILPGGYHPQ